MKILEEISRLTQKLISFKSTADQPEVLIDIIDYIESYFSSTNLKVQRLSRNQKPSLLVTSGQESPEITLNGHADVVSAKDEQFSPTVKDGKIYGRGALDMKGGLSVLMVLAKTLSQQLNANHSTLNAASVAFSFTTDEEIGGKDGTGLLIKQGIRPKFYLSAEPTDLMIGNEARGVIWLKVKALGKSAHASTPWLGDNANLKLLKALGKVSQAYPVPPQEQWITTCNVSVLNGGDSVNKVPDVAEAKLDIRYIPTENPDEIIRQIENLCPDCEIKVLMKEPAAYTNPNDSYSKKLQSSIAENGLEPKLLQKYAASDARYFSALKIPAVVFGPSGQGQHSESEWVDLTSLLKTYNILYDFIHQA